MDLSGWCTEHLGAAPAAVLFEHRSISAVFGVRLDDGREVVVKAREDEERVAACLRAQAILADRGFPCPKPLTPVIAGVHAEELRPGGEMLVGDTPDIAARYAEVFATLMRELADVDEKPLPNPRWARWDHADPGLWPAIPLLDEKDQSAVPAFITRTAERVRERLQATNLPCVLGHADFEAQNLRWHGTAIWAVHDWDSLAWQPEAALVGAASGAFASTTPPTLAPIESSAAFLDAYGRLTAEELEIAWAASLWPALHNARWEALHGDPPLCGKAVREQAEERLRRAGVD